MLLSKTIQLSFSFTHVCLHAEFYIQLHVCCFWYGDNNLVRERCKINISIKLFNAYFYTVQKQKQHFTDDTICDIH